MATRSAPAARPHPVRFGALLAHQLLPLALYAAFAPMAALVCVHLLVALRGWLFLRGLGALALSARRGSR